jgi:hypothetical protein
MDWVGVELTTSAHRQHSQAAVYPLFFITYLKRAAMERELYNEIPLRPFLLFWENTALNTLVFGHCRTKLTRNAWGKFDIKKFYWMRGYLISRDIMRRLALIVPSLSGSVQYYNTTYIYSALLFRTTE